MTSSNININQNFPNNPNYLLNDEDSRYFYGDFVNEESKSSKGLTEPLINYNEKEIININSNNKIVNNEENEQEESSKFEIVKQLKVIKDHKSNSSFINELSNGFIIMSTYDKHLLFYTKNFKLILTIKFPHLVRSINEIKDNNNKNIIKLICCSTFYIYIITLDLTKIDMVVVVRTEIRNSDDETHQIYIINEFKRDYNSIVDHFNYYFFIQLKNNQQYFCTNHGVYEGNNLLNKKEKHPKLVLFEHYIEGVPINDNLICFKSNEMYVNGKSLLTLYDCKSNSIINKIEGYSFSLLPYRLFLLSINEKNKYLLCSCMKIKNNKSNGILIVNYNINSDEEIDAKETFYSTESFNINCICKLNVIKDNDEKDKENNQIFFLAGGVDDDYNSGIVKLFRFNISENESNIEELQKIELGENANGPISCIYQLEDGKIIVSCGTGNILLTRPNLDGYNDDNDFSF